jgi:hypothetical protein
MLWVEDAGKKRSGASQLSKSDIDKSRVKEKEIRGTAHESKKFAGCLIKRMALIYDSTPSLVP